VSGLWRRARRIARGKLARLAARGGTAAWPHEPERVDAGQGSKSASPPRPDPERARALSVLELPAGASGEEIRSAYRRLCRRYHPDRFESDPGKCRAANELLAEINAAYELLRGER
jgi:DnaJ-domain-containing protein 1